MIDLLWEREVEAAPWDTPERAAALKKRLRVAVQLINDPDVRAYTRKKLKPALIGCWANRVCLIAQPVIDRADEPLVLAPSVSQKRNAPFSHCPRQWHAAARSTDCAVRHQSS